MRSNAIALLLALAPGLGLQAAFAKDNLNKPAGERRAWAADSGPRANAAAQPKAVHTEKVHVPGAAWLRVHFGELDLEPGSSVRITSLADGEQQVLDAAACARWSNSTAYFNGDTVVVELVAGGRTLRNRMQVSGVSLAMLGPGGGVAGMCGPDDRLPSAAQWTARLFPPGCTASVFSTDSCMVSAGHCISQGMVAQFNVPASLPDCTPVNPPVADQFPIENYEFRFECGNGGLETDYHDWAVLKPGRNNLGQLPYERYGRYRPIASVPAQTGDAVAVWGYGADDECTRDNVQQHSTGMVTGVGTDIIEYDVDVTHGNSGAALMRAGQIVGIVTHGIADCVNGASRIDRPDFAAARAALCAGAVPPPPANDICAFATELGSGDRVTAGFDNHRATADFFVGWPALASCGTGHEWIVADLWYSWTAPRRGMAIISACSDQMDVAVAVYSACPTENFQELACSLDGCTGGSIQLPVAAGQQLVVRVGSTGFACPVRAGPGTLSIRSVKWVRRAEAPEPVDSVIVDDMLALVSAWGPNPGSDADLDGDGAVGVQDLLMLIDGAER